jgi:hypothetical protein
MTELMRQLPKDLQREVWSFLGMESLGYTPSATAFIKFVDDTENYGCPYQIFWGSDVNIDYYDTDMGVPVDRPYPFISRRNFIIFHYFHSFQREISLEKFPKLDMKEVGLWYEGVRCDANCGCNLTTLEFPYRNHHDYKCDNCYGVDTGMIKDDEFVEQVCRECLELMTGAEWKKNRENGEWFCFSCDEYLENNPIIDSEDDWSINQE